MFVWCFWALINSLVCWLCMSTLGLILFQNVRILPLSDTENKCCFSLLFLHDKLATIMHILSIPSLVTKVEQFRRYRLNKARHTDRQRGGQMDMAIPSYLPNFGKGVYKNKVYKMWEVTFWQPDYFSQSMGMQDSKLISCHLLSFSHAFSSHNVHFVLFLLLLFLYTSAWNYPLNMHFPHQIHTLRCNNEIIFFF